MRSRSVTFGYGRRAISLTIWKDLGLCKATRSFYVLVGLDVSRNNRIDAMTRCSIAMIAIGPIGITFTKFYNRE